MSVLIIGGDKIIPIIELLNTLGITQIEHWDGRNKKVTKKTIPQKTDCLLLLTNFLNHNTMYKFKNEAKKREIPFICTDRHENSIMCAFCTKFEVCRNICHKGE